MAARRPVRSTNCTAAATFGPIEPAANVPAFSSSGRDLGELALLRRPPALVHAVDVGGHHEQVGVDLPGEQLAGQVLVDHRLDAREHPFAPGLEGRRDAAAAGADHDGLVLQQPLDGPELEDPLGER